MALPGRTTGTLVRAVIETDVDVSLDPFIDAANELVTEICAGVLRSDGVTLFYTNYRLAMIEMWLAAHMYTVFEPRAVRERVATLTQENQSKVDLGLDTSHYGQNAMRLDTNGGLAALNNRMKKATTSSGGVKGPLRASLRWGGTDYCNGVPPACP